jgi:hypothetical protein
VIDIVPTGVTVTEVHVLFDGVGVREAGAAASCWAAWLAPLLGSYRILVGVAVDGHGSAGYRSSGPFPLVCCERCLGSCQTGFRHGHRSRWRCCVVSCVGVRIPYRHVIVVVAAVSRHSTVAVLVGP